MSNSTFWKIFKKLILGQRGYSESARRGDTGTGGRGSSTALFALTVSTPEIYSSDSSPSATTGLSRS